MRSCKFYQLFTEQFYLKLISDTELPGFGSEMSLPGPDPDPTRSFGSNRIRIQQHCIKINHNQYIHVARDMVAVAVTAASTVAVGGGSCIV